MYGIALSVAACVRAGTRVDVAWVNTAPGPSSSGPLEAVAITPGGGRIGSMFSGALDSQLSDLASVHAGKGRLVTVDIGATDAALAGVQPASGIQCVLLPATELPEELWEALLAREPVCLVSEVDGATITSTLLFTSETIDDAGHDQQRLFRAATAATELATDTLTTVLWPRPTMLVVGGGGIAASLEKAGSILGWKTIVTNARADATGIIATLAPLDSVVVLGHDLELTGSALMAALDTDVGYIGAVGPPPLQDARAEWLAYRDATDLARIHGPAGLDIGARTPDEIAVAIVAEVIAERRRAGGA